MSDTARELAREWANKWFAAPVGEQFRIAESLSVLLIEFAAKVRLEEAEWWQDHIDKVHAYERKQRRAQLKSEAGQT